MVEAEEAAFELLVSHEQFAKASEPAMRDFHNPSPGSLRRIPALLIGFLSAPFDVRNVLSRVIQISPVMVIENSPPGLIRR